MKENQHLMTLFEAALDCESETERVALLDRECGQDVARRSRVEALLQAHEGAGRFLEPGTRTPTIDATAAEVADSSLAGTVLAGKYKLLESIGEGGMGAVWTAQQFEPVKRLVAVKLIKPGMDSKQVLARFEAERQALALMDHPNIAKVFDGGATADGRPFFVMELVRGVPITKYCDEHHLTPRQRLELFVPVCQAIQHAHQKGIIHRDIKPSNVLVAMYDDRPVPKVIDFGIAKATGSALTDKTLVTGLGNVVGTLEYMSPEQAELDNLDVDTRSDVYSLGAVLYELLAGSTPFTKKEFEQAGMYEMLRVIREQEPSKPSTKLSTAEGLPTLAANRGTEPKQLTRQVRGELDWIVMKSLEKDRSRRYETANSFAMDVQRYLSDEPIEACPPSAGYRFRKFARRNKAALATAVLVSLGLLVGLVGLIISNVRISHEKEEKENALTTAKLNYEEAKKQTGLAKDNAAMAETQRGIAVDNEKSAKAHELLARRRLYASQMNLAMQAWHSGEIPRVLELLEGQRPRADQEDLRGFEWYYLWRLCNAGRRQWLDGPNRAVSSIAFSPDGKTLVSATWDARVQLWDAETGKSRAVLQGHQDFAWEVAISPDGKLLASGGKETSTLILWDASTGKRLHTIPGRVAGIAFSPDSRTLAGGAITDKGIDAKFWDVATGVERSSIELAGVVIGFFPDGKTLVTQTGRYAVPGQGIVLWNVETKAWRKRIAATDIRAVVLSVDGTRVATSSHSIGDPIRVWDTATGKEVATLTGHGGVKRTLAFSKDGKKLASGSNDRTAVVWDIDSGRQIGQEVHLDPLSAVAFSPDGKTLASSTLGGAIKLWDMAAPVESLAFSVGPGTASIAFSPNSQTLVVAGDGPTRVFHASTGKEQAVLSAKGVLAISPDTSMLAGMGPGEAKMIWDVRAERGVTTLPTGSINVAAFSPDAKILATSRVKDGPTVRLWDISTGQSRTLTIEPPLSNRQFVTCMSFSSDGQFLVAGFTFQWITVWEVATGKVKLQFNQGPALMNVLSVAFSPDNKMFAVGTDVGTVTLWETDSGRLMTSFKGHTLPVRSLAFSPDGKTLATACADKTVRLWDVATGQERITIKGHPADVIRVAFAPDGSTMATACADGTVKLWHGATSAVARAYKSENDLTDPESISGQLRGARAIWSTGRFQDALKEYRLAIARLKTLHRAQPHVGHDRELLAVHLEFARVLAGMEKWDDAATEFVVVCEHSPDDLEVVFDYSAILLLKGDTESYRQLCARLLGRISNLRRGNLPGRRDYLLARILLMTPDAQDSVDQSLRLAQEAVKAEPNAHHLHTLGLAHYRAGHFDKAFELLQRSMDADPKWPAHPASWLVRAMAFFRSDHPSEARRWLDQAIELVEKDRAEKLQRTLTGLGMHPHDWMAWLILRREAEALIKANDKWPATRTAN